MRPFDGKRVLLGVSGGIAAYKAAELCRRLVQSGARVDVILTDGGSRFVGPTTFEGLTGRKVRRSLWENPLDHLELGRSADVLVVAPATADVLAKLAGGHADDLLTTTILAAPHRAIVAPAMNHRMYEHPATRRNLELLREFGHEIVGPEYGELAEREEGWGRMAEPESIHAHIGRALEPPSRWRGRRVVVTAGPTREPVDAVRYLGNRSSGRMGFAVAASAWRRGAEVTLITGPTELSVPPGIDHVERVSTASEMCGALQEAASDADAVVMVAAVADYRPSRPAEGKIRRADGMDAIEVESVPDLLGSLGEDTGRLKIAFAVELGEGSLESARAKLRDKGAHLVVVNDPTQEGAAFETETNRATLISASGEEAELPLMLKTELADEILDRAERWLRDE